MATTVDIQQNTKNRASIQSRDMIVAAATTIYQGTIGRVDAAGDAVAAGNFPFAGIAQSQGSTGDVITFYLGHSCWIEKTDASKTDVTKTAYAASNNSATLTPNNCILGPIIDWAPGKILVWLTGRA